MRTTKKALMLVACAAVLVVTSVFGTLAYLTDHETATNTFTVGSVGLSLSETDVKPDGTKDTDARVISNEYHLIPGHVYIKDPTVSVDKGSEKAYIRMVVEVKRVDLLKESLPQMTQESTIIEANQQYYADLNGDSVADFVLEKMLNGTWNYQQWHFESYTENGTSGVYEFRYYMIVDAVDATEDMTLEPLFAQIKVPGEIDNAHLALLNDVEIVVNAHAIQADGFDSADEAWSHFTN